MRPKTMRPKTMHVETTNIEGVWILHPKVFEDERGCFFETYHETRFEAHGLPTVWVQDNHARSLRDTVRGLHFQRGPGQAKLVRCVRGALWDVAVDLRTDSPTFGRWVARELTEDNKEIMLISEGFAHGYAVLSDTAEMLYKCSRIYDPDLEDGIRWDDPDLAVAWPVSEPILSPRDRSAQSLKQYMNRTDP